ncbi:MAG: HAD-IA family hydrolase [Treponema sp.]|nr:HAD-IA family hydrolase [Treponema sp.]
MKLYIFDLGGVCIFNFQTIGKIAKKYHIVEKDLYAHYMQHESAVMDGSLSPKAWWLAAAQKFKVDENADPLIDLFTPYVNEPVIEIIKEMKAQGKRVVCGSNTCELHWQAMNACGNLAQLFDECYLSQRMHLVKPNAAFFEYILKAEDVEANDAFFTDDTQANVAAARACGINGLHFCDEFAWSSVDKLRNAVL